jgi:DNA-binding CsgD family transcriptional regulator
MSIELSEHQICCACSICSDQPQYHAVVHLIYNQSGDISSQEIVPTAWHTIQCSSWPSFTQQLICAKPVSVEIPVELFEQFRVTAAEFVSMVQSLCRLIYYKSSVFIGVGINQDTDFNTIKRLKSAGVCGIVPSIESFGTIEYTTAVNLLSQGQSYWPEHVVNSLPGVCNITHTESGAQLTPRQRQVYDLICHRGLSNKQIARALDLSESTVKIHVSSIMKTLGVRNRTQMAVNGGAGLRA